MGVFGVHFGDLGLHFGVFGLRFGVFGFHFGILGLHLGVLGLRFGVLGLNFGAQGCFGLNLAPFAYIFAFWGRLFLKNLSFPDLKSLQNLEDLQDFRNMFFTVRFCLMFSRFR